MDNREGYAAACARVGDMSFEDLPPDWPTRPVTDPAITADLLDLVVRERDREEGAIGLLLCGPGGRLAQPVVIPSPPVGAAPQEREKPFAAVCRALESLDGTGRPGLLIAVARPGSPFAGSEDLAWRDAATRVCGDYDVDLLGVWLMTPAVIRPLPPAAPQEQSA